MSELKLPIITFEQSKAIVEGLAVVVDDLGVSLQQLGKNAPGPVRCDFVAGAAKHRRLFGGGRGQDIAKAVGLKHKGFKPKILDLTAGLGRDSFVLASLGASLLMLERHPIVFALLEDGLSRAREHVLDRVLGETDQEELADILSRISAIGEGAETYLRRLDERSKPDIIYIDPMFPTREKSSKVKKEMQLFHQLVGTDDDSSELLPLALEKAKYRVVVKRPAHAPFLAEHLKQIQPGYSLKGKSTRFDVYPIKKLP